MLKIVFLLVDSFKLLHLLKTIKLWVKIKVKLNLNTLENFIVEKGIKRIEQNGVHVAYLTCPQIKLNKYKDATMLSLWHIKGDSMDFILDMPELQDIRMYACKFNDYTALSKSTHLRKLCINGIATKEEQTFDYIANLSSLEELIIGYIQPFIQISNLSNLHSYINLFILNVKI